MFEKEAEEYFETVCLHSYADTEEQLKEDVVPAFQKGAELGYNKALEDIMAKVKTHGLISTELGYSDVFDYENNRISEDVLWDRFEDNAQRELSMVIEDMRIDEEEDNI